MKYNKILKLRITEAEQQSLASAALARNLTVAELVRDMFVATGLIAGDRVVATDKTVVATSVRTSVTKGVVTHSDKPVVQTKPVVRTDVKQPSSPKNEKPFVCLLKGVK